ncbi:Glc-6-P isomerase [Auriculariales sp. MPI-PUGE-AT-0066]|nr:Glc-6-P isomerase [Auriculariales sp. MPI-PUGE-AT-0066]
MAGRAASDYAAWKQLEQLYASDKARLVLKDLFAADSNRFKTFSREYTDSTDSSNTFLLDFSKNLIDDKILTALLALVREAGLETARDAMFKGEHINTSEDRAVLHVALRDPKHHFSLTESGVSDVPAVLAHIKDFTDKVRSGEWKGYTGKRITTIVNIGIGGSDLGPVMVTEALKSYAQRNISARFVSNIDGTHLAETLRDADPETTLFIEKTHVAKHFVALSTNTKAVTEFGIAQENMFQFWDWVGGRYSLWSAIGLSIALVIGYDNFSELLAGAHAMDRHFTETKLEDNLPVLLAVLGIWYNDFYGAQTHVLLPYDQYLHQFANYFQQGDMESNGKFITKQGQRVDYQTAGTNGQHSFYQLLHQGTKLIPADFIAPATSHNPISNSLHHRILLSNFFAQPEALAFGKTEEQVRKEVGANASEALVKSKVFEGNHPSNSILLPKVTPRSLGSLIALYEHKIFTQGVVWGINSFDQMGVELGKVLAKNILAQLGKSEDVVGHDSSTTGLIHYYQKVRVE